MRSAGNTRGERGRRNTPGRVLRAVAPLCAAAVLLTAPGTAHAVPVPDPGPSAPAGVRPGDKSLDEVRRDIDALYLQAASATDAYNAAEEEVERQSKEVSGLTAELVAGEKRLKALKDRAGASARAQYRNGGLPPEAEMMLTGDARHFLDSAGRLKAGQQATTGLIAELTRAQEDLELYAQDASSEWHRLEQSRRKKATAKKQIEAGVAAAEKLETRLAKTDRKRLLELERQAAQRSQTAWLASGALDGAGGTASARGERAVEYALGQLGKPYVWGAEGPGSFDCSGLTSTAWGAAGRIIPRTSQMQWKSLPRVDISDIAPGDLVVYRSDASHVGLYIGDGKIVHAPRPGRNVTVTGAGTMPILGVVRPDR